MPTVFAVIAFVLAYGAGAEVLNRLTVFCFDVWDRKFHSQAGNIAVFHEALPLLAALATLSFLAGLAVHRRRLIRASIGAVVAHGAASGLVASALLLVFTALQAVHGLGLAGLLAGQLVFWAGPAATAVVVFRHVRGNPAS